MRISYQNQDWLSENWLRFGKKQKKLRLLQGLMIVVAEILGGSLGCGRKSMVSVALDQRGKY